MLNLNEKNKDALNEPKRKRLKIKKDVKQCLTVEQYSQSNLVALPSFSYQISTNDEPNKKGDY